METHAMQAPQHNYRMVIYWSEQDQLWLVEVPELPGAMADGKTPTEAIAMAQEVIENWLEVARMDGRPIPAPQAGQPVG
jgi:predicted RNase H-like HicB family nuclease